MSYVKGDPYWLTTRYPGTCFSCDERVNEGTRALYWPKGGRSKLQCEACGTASYQRFEAEIADEV